MREVFIHEVGRSGYVAVKVDNAEAEAIEKRLYAGRTVNGQRCVCFIGSDGTFVHVEIERISIIRIRPVPEEGA